MQSDRRKSLPAVTIPQTERWIQGTPVEGNINYLSNTDATKNFNEVPAVKTKKKQEKSWHIVWRFFLIERKNCC